MQVLARNVVSPQVSPVQGDGAKAGRTRESEPQGTPMGLRVEDGWKKRKPVCNGPDRG